MQPGLLLSFFRFSLIIELLLLLAQSNRPPAAESLLAFSPSDIFSSLWENTKVCFPIEFTSVLTLSACVVCVALNVHSMPRHLEAMIERLGGLWSHRANTAAAHSSHSCSPATHSSRRSTCQTVVINTVVRVGEFKLTEVPQSTEILRA